MSRTLSFLFASFISLALANGAYAQNPPLLSEAPGPSAAPMITTSEPAPMYFSLGIGIGLSYTSIDIPRTRTASGDQPADAIGAFGTLTIGGHVLQLSDNLDFLLGYRGSVEQFLLGVIDTGLIHRHELSATLVINRNMHISLGAGPSLLHDEDLIVPGVASHLDIRYVFGGGFYAGFPLLLNVFMGDRDDVVDFSWGLEFGWHSFN